MKAYLLPFALALMPFAANAALSVTCGTSVDATKRQIYNTEMSLNLETKKVTVRSNGQYYVSSGARVETLSSGNIKVIYQHSRDYPGADIYEIENPNGKFVVKADVIRIDDEYNRVYPAPLQCLVSEWQSPTR